MGRRASPLPRGAPGRRTRRGEAAERRVGVEPELGGSNGDGAARVSRGGGGTGSRGFGEGARCFYRGEDRASACGPRCVGRRATTGLRLESEPGTWRKRGPTSVPHLAVTEGEGCQTRPGRGRRAGPAVEFWATGKKRKKREREKEMGLLG